MQAHDSHNTKCSALSTYHQGFSRTVQTGHRQNRGCSISRLIRSSNNQVQACCALKEEQFIEKEKKAHSRSTLHWMTSYLSNTSYSQVKKITWERHPDLMAALQLFSQSSQKFLPNQKVDYLRSSVLLQETFSQEKTLSVLDVD